MHHIPLTRQMPTSRYEESVLLVALDTVLQMLQFSKTASGNLLCSGAFDVKFRQIRHWLGKVYPNRLASRVVLTMDFPDVLLQVRSK